MKRHHQYAVKEETKIVMYKYCQ